MFYYIERLDPNVYARSTLFHCAKNQMYGKLDNITKELIQTKKKSSAEPLQGYA